jgi:hypothetical protein
MGISFIELVPVPDALSFDYVFDTCVVLDLSVIQDFSVKFVPIFKVCMLVLDELNWFCLFIELAGCFVKGEKLCCIRLCVVIPEYTVFEIFWFEVTVSLDMFWKIIYCSNCYFGRPCWFLWELICDEFCQSGDLTYVMLC